jgi:hypothetical protein
MKKRNYLLLLASACFFSTPVQAKTGDIRVNSVTVDSASGENLGGFNSNQPLDRMFKAQKQLVFQVIRQAGIDPDELPPEIKAEVSKVQTNNVKALMSFSKGIDALDKGNFGDAKKAFAQASKADPGFSLAKKLSRAMPSENRNEMAGEKKGGDKGKEKAKDKNKEKLEDKKKKKTEDKKKKSKKIIEKVTKKSKTKAKKIASKVASSKDEKKNEFMKKNEVIQPQTSSSEQLTTSETNTVTEISFTTTNETQNQSVQDVYQTGEELGIVGDGGKNILAMAVGILAKYYEGSLSEVITPPLVTGELYPIARFTDNQSDTDISGLPSTGVKFENSNGSYVAIDQSGDNLSYSHAGDSKTNIDASNSDYVVATPLELSVSGEYLDLGYVSNMGYWESSLDPSMTEYTFWGDRIFVVNGTRPNPSASIVQTNQNYTYSGGVQGLIGTTGSSPELASGSFSADVNFGSSSALFNTFSMNSTSYEANANGVTASINTSDMSFKVESGVGHAGPIGSVETGTSYIHGSFFGSDNSGMGGEFHVITSTTPYLAVGAFTGKK